MHQLRWNAVLQQWIAVTTSRQNRPQMPANWCPFDPGSGNVPDQYDVHLYPNDFPAFSPDVSPFVPEQGLFAQTSPRGACDVVLYSPEHNLPPSQLSVENWLKIVQLWTQRTAEHAADPSIAFVAVFENCGEAVGVTMPHPHGQIYAMPFVSPVVCTELTATARHAALHEGECLFCRLLQEEVANGSRVVAQNEHGVAYVPFAARFPGEIGLYLRRHVRTLLDLSPQEQQSLAELLSIIRRKYDNLYGFQMPLMMAVKQAPLQDAKTPYHLHVQFLPLQRSQTKLKYLATIETGYGTFLADTAPEGMAAALRNSEPVTGVQTRV